VKALQVASRRGKTIRFRCRKPQSQSQSDCELKWDQHTQELELFVYRFTAMSEQLSQNVDIVVRLFLNVV